MHYDVVEARHVRNYIVWLRFRDGRHGEIDLEPALRGPVFEPLKDVGSFRQLFVHPEFATLAWPNNVDMAPETLYAGVAQSHRNEYADSAISATLSGELRHSGAASNLRQSAAVAVPEIARFFGIVITMFYDEHGRPHFHARAGDDAVSVEIGTQTIRGTFPGRSLRFVLEWEELHRDELMANWDRARQGLPLLPIEPLK